jgi:hypothetical protein
MAELGGGGRESLADACGGDAPRVILERQTIGSA